MSEAFNSHHEAECDIIVANPEGFRFDVSARMLFRVLRMWEKNYMDENDWLSLDLFSQNKSRLRKAKRVTMPLLNAVKKYAECQDPVRSIEKVFCVVSNSSPTRAGLILKQLLSHLIPVCHAEAGVAEGGTQYGQAIDLTAAIINHDCNPNAFIYFEEGHIRVRAQRKIKAGEEITVSYCDSVLDRHHRDKELQAQHFFECNCTRCCEEEAYMLDVGQNFSRLIRTRHFVLIRLMQAIGWDRQLGPVHHLDEFKTVADLTARQSFPDGEWPASYEMLGLLNLHIARCDSMYGRHCLALQRGFAAVLSSGRREGPAWCNRMLIMAIILCRALRWLDNEVSPRSAVRRYLSAEDVRLVTVGWLRELAWITRIYFGGADRYTKAVKVCYRSFAVDEPRRLSKEFTEEFEAAQIRLLELFRVAGEGTPCKKIALKLSC
jgi:SET and MYND domain-containing protein